MTTSMPSPHLSRKVEITSSEASVPFEGKNIPVSTPPTPFTVRYLPVESVSMLPVRPPGEDDLSAASNIAAMAPSEKTTSAPVPILPVI